MPSPPRRVRTSTCRTMEARRAGDGLCTWPGLRLWEAPGGGVGREAGGPARARALRRRGARRVSGRRLRAAPRGSALRARPGRALGHVGWGHQRRAHRRRPLARGAVALLAAARGGSARRRQRALLREPRARAAAARRGRAARLVARARAARGLPAPRPPARGPAVGEPPRAVGGVPRHRALRSREPSPRAHPRGASRRHDAAARAAGRGLRRRAGPAPGRALAVNAVDAHTGAIVRYVAGGAGTVKDLSRQPDYVLVDAITVDMVLASASIPLLFPAVPVGGRLLWDGGLLVNTPLAPVVDLGADEIVTILVTPRPRARGDAPFANLGEAIERTVDGFLENAYNVDRKLLLARNRLASLEPHYRTVTLFEAVRPGDERCFRAGSYVYFAPEVLAEMRSAGRRAAAAWLAEGPRVDHLEPPPPARTIVHIPLPPRRRDALQPA